MKKRNAIVLVLFLTVSSFAAYSQGDKDADEKELLSRYAVNCLKLSTEKTHPVLPSEREIVINAARAMRDKKVFQPYAGEMKKHPHIDEYRIGKPIEVVKLVSGTTRPDLYYYVVPFFYAGEGIRLIVMYTRNPARQDKEGHYISREARAKIIPSYNYDFEMRYSFDPEQPWYPATHLITEGEAAALIEKYFQVSIQNKVRAVYGFAPRGPIEVDDWFWYTRIEEGISYQGRTIYGVFVNPYAMVRDDRNVHLEELATKESVGRLAGALIKDRFYTFQEKDIDVYRLETEAREVDPEMNSFKKLSDWPPEKDSRLIPLVPVNLPPDTGTFKEPTMLERMKKADAERKKAEKEENAENEKLLDLYMSPEVTLNRAPIYDYLPSEHNAAVAAAKRIRRDLDIMVRMNFDNKPDELLNKYKLGQMGKPIAIRSFRGHNDGDLTRIYAFYVPFLYGKEFIGWVNYNWNLEGRFDVGALQTQSTLEYKRYLLNEKDVTALLEKNTGIKFKQVPIAVSFPYPRFAMSERDFLWYAYNEQGIEKNGKVCHSFFVFPIVNRVADVEKVTFEELMAPPYKSLITSRVYVLEEEMNLYEADRKEKTGEMSFDQEAFRKSREHKKQYGTYDREVPPFDLQLIPFTP